MTDNSANHAKRYGGHNEKGLAVTSKRYGKQGIHGKERQNETFSHTGHGILPFFFLTFQVVGESRIISCQLSKNGLLQVCKDFLGISLIAVNSGSYIGDPFTVGPVDHAVSSSFADISGLLQGDLTAVRRSDAHGFKIPEILAILLRVANHHLDLIPAPLQAQGFRTVKRSTYLPSKAFFGYAKGTCRRLQPDFKLLFSLRIGVFNIAYTRILGQKFFQPFGTLHQR